MDTPSTRPLFSRRLRIAFFVAMLLLVSSAFAYLLSWIDPPRAPLLVRIELTSKNRVEATLPFAEVLPVASERRKIEQALGELARCGASQPVVVYISGPAIHRETGAIQLLPGDASPDDPTTWLPLRDVLEKLKACPAKDRLLVLDLSAPASSIYHDIAASLPRELDAVPDVNRHVLSSCSAGQRTHVSGELGQSIFAYYFRDALRGGADGYGGLRDGHISVQELTAFVQARVDRWARHNRGEGQTPILLGAASDFTIASVDSDAPRDLPGVLPEKNYPETLLTAWRERDRAYQTGDFRWTPRAFQRAQARLLRAERVANENAEGIDLQERVEARAQAKPTGARKAFAESWRVLQHQLSSARPVDVERIKSRFVEEMRQQIAAPRRDALLFAQVLADPRRDPGLFRLCDQLLQPAPGTPESLRLSLLADLAMRVEVHAWPRDLVDTLLRCTDEGERAFRATPSMPGYVAMLEEPAQSRHAGEVRLWTRGYSSLDDAKARLTSATVRFERLNQLNQKWRERERAFADIAVELPWYVEALELIPELRDPWEKAVVAVRNLAAALAQPNDETQPWEVRENRLQRQLADADAAIAALEKHRAALHAPFARDAILRLERQCRAPQADAQTRQTASALLSVAGPSLKADDRVLLSRAVQKLSRRLHDEAMTMDRQDDELGRQTPMRDTTSAGDSEPERAASRASWQLALCELAGVPQERIQALKQQIERCRKNPAEWCAVAASLRTLTHRDMTEQYSRETQWRNRERLAWALPPLDTFKEIDAEKTSPTREAQRREIEKRDRWLLEHQKFLARDYAGLGFDSPGIVAAHAFYANAAGKFDAGPYLRMGIAATVEPLTAKQPEQSILLEVTRIVPPGTFGPVELTIQRSDDVWLDVSPSSATLPPLSSAREARTVSHKVPLQATRKAKAERSGLPPPLGFLVEARFEGRTYHHLVTVPVVPTGQELQILVSADPDEPGTTLGEIRVRPGKVKQPHYVYLKNLTNRMQRVHVEIKAGDAIVHKSQRVLTIDADGVRKVGFEETQRTLELRGPLQIRVLDAERQKVLDEKTLKVAVLSPQEYVKAADAKFEPGETGNRWAVELEAARPMHGPAIVAQLVLPVQRIPGLMAVGGGTLRVDLPPDGNGPRVLFAENLRLLNGAKAEGPVYLHIDGVPRAFVYRTTFSRMGEPSVTIPDDTPAVRIAAPRCVMAGINCLVDLEVDNAPPGCRLEVALGRTLQDGGFKAELTREFKDAKRRKIDLETAKDALVFDAAISDWTATFDTRLITGARELQARLIDAGGKQIASARQAVIIDDTPPFARIAPPPAALKKGSILQIQADGADPESGVAQVVFFFGKPDRGEIPPGAPRFKAIPATRDLTVWRAALMMPTDYKGPLPISVQVVNNAGLSSIDTVVIDITDNEPGRTGKGDIRGKVSEGPRPQPNLLVTLHDQTGKEIARTRTDKDGDYVFPQLAPGQYRVICVKPESQRRAVLNVIVEPDRPARGDMALAL